MIKHCDKCGKALIGIKSVDIVADEWINLTKLTGSSENRVKRIDLCYACFETFVGWLNKVEPKKEEPKKEEPKKEEPKKEELKKEPANKPFVYVKPSVQSKSVQRREEIQKAEDHLGLNDMVKFADEHANEIFPEDIQVRERDGKEYLEDVSKRILTCFKKKLVKKGITTEKIFIEKCSTLDRWISVMDYHATAAIQDAYSEVYFRILRIMKTEGYPINRLQELELRNHDNPDDDMEIKREKFSTKRQHA
jgi:hypothetical protein